MSGEWIPWSQRRELLDRELRARDGSDCVWCSAELQPGTETLEHVVPAGRGGPKHIDNLMLACHRCNNSRGFAPALEWLGMLEAAGKPVLGDTVRSAFGRAWSSVSFSVAAAVVFELCHMHQVASAAEFQLVRPQLPWRIDTAAEDLALHFIEEIHLPVERRLETLAAEVAAADTPTRKQFALEFALHLPPHEQYAAFRLLDGDEDAARRSLRRLRTIRTLDVTRLGRLFPAAA